MLPFPEFTFEAPDTIDDLVALAAAPDTRLVSGGTDLLPSLKHRLFEPRAVVSLARVSELHGITQTDAGLTLGATTTLSEVAAHPAVQSHYPALAAACRSVGTSTIQAMGTLGGNLMLDTRCLFFNQPAGWRQTIGGCLKCEGNVCHVARSGTGCYAAHSADTVPVLWLMGAEVDLVSSKGQRRMAVSALFDDDGLTPTVLARGEILTAIHLPRPRGFVSHRKLRLRGAIDYPLLLCAVRREGAGATAVISAIGPRPIEIEVASAGDLPDAAWQVARPLNTHATSTTWRRHMVRVEVRRALEAAVR